MVGVEKAAILLATLGPEAAAGVFRHLSEPEVRQLSAAIARLRSIPRERAAAVHEEAWRRLTEREGLLVDGEQFARQMIAAALTGTREERPADKAAQPGGEFLAASLDPVAPAALAQVLGREHPQVIALVLANLRARKAAEVLAALPEDLHRLDDRGMQTLLKEIARDDLMLALKPASPAMREKIFGNLAQRTAEILQEDMGVMGPVRLKDVERAQARIVAAARRLDAEQRITLGAHEGDVVV